MRIVMFPLLALVLAACSGEEEIRESQKAPLSQQIAEGRGIASTMCAGCHGMDDDEEGVRGNTIALKYVLNRMDPETLHSNFEQGIKIGHPDMPEFVFGPLGSDVLLAYLESIREPDPTEN